MTLTFSNTVSSGLSIVTWPASWAEVVGSLSSWITPSNTDGLVTMSAYDLTRCWMKVLPWVMSETFESESEAETETKSWVVAEYIAVCRAV